MPTNTKYHGTVLKTPESLSPTFESIIIIQCLKAIHPDLPEYIMNNKGMLFTSDTPNFCDTQQELCDTMDTLLPQMEAQNSISRLQAFDCDTTETLRWANANPRGRPTNLKTFQNRRIGSTLRPNPNAIRLQQKKKVCDYCVALGKDEKVWATHDKLTCYDLFPEKRRNRVNARMVSIPVSTDENDMWDLQEAIDSIENQFYSCLLYTSDAADE